jgi:hypothetical protein
MLSKAVVLGMVEFHIVLLTVDMFVMMEHIAQVVLAVPQLTLRRLQPLKYRQAQMEHGLT